MKMKKLFEELDLKMMLKTVILLPLDIDDIEVGKRYLHMEVHSHPDTLLGQLCYYSDFRILSVDGVEATVKEGDKRERHSFLADEGLLPWKRPNEQRVFIDIPANRKILEDFVSRQDVAGYLLAIGYTEEDIERIARLNRSESIFSFMLPRLALTRNSAQRRLRYKK
jgi:hypothetical protein